MFYLFIVDNSKNIVFSDLNIFVIVFGTANNLIKSYFTVNH